MVTLYLAIAVNGAVATGQGDTPWGRDSWQHYIDYTNNFGNMIVGRRTYDLMLAAGDFKLFTGKPRVVVVSSTPAPPTEHVEFVANPASALELLAGAERVLLGGGPSLAASMIQANQVDEIHLDIEPLLIGNGLPLIANDMLKDLELLDVSRYPTGLTVKYRVIKEIS